jgi:hypothetical protein
MVFNHIVFKPVVSSQSFQATHGSLPRWEDVERLSTAVIRSAAKDLVVIRISNMHILRRLRLLSMTMLWTFPTTGQSLHEIAALGKIGLMES